MANDIASKDSNSRGASAVACMMRPKSIAIIGISSKPGTAGHIVLAGLTINNFAGDIYLVGRSGGEIEGRIVRTSVCDLPEGVDLAIFTLPASGVKDAIVGCIERKVGAAVVFASGFSEVGNREAQDEIADIARDGGITLLGPNCLGFTNFVDQLTIGFASARPLPPPPAGSDPAVAIISHSGGLMSHLRMGFDLRGLPTTYTVSTGNEAGLHLGDFVDFFAQDPATRVVVVYAEEIRDPQSFLRSAARARDAGKPVLMMHPGRGQRAQAAVASHTGALAGDYEIMRAQVTHSGIMLVDTLDELLDATEILARFPVPPVKGPGIVTFSGAFCAIAHDFCEDLNLEVPPLSTDTEDFLKPQLPDFAPPKNPLDLTTEPIWRPELMGLGPKALLDDPAIGSLVISIMVGSPQQSINYINALVDALKDNSKPVVFSILGDQSPLAPEFLEIARKNRIIISRSADRSLRAISSITLYGRALERIKSVVDARPFKELPALGKGPQPEWLGKQVLNAIGVGTPASGLAQSIDEAVTLATSVGFPVAMKGQSAALAHKTEAGAVLLNITDEASARVAWETLAANVAKAQPGLALDGVLVEKMSDKGLELVVGARRDPRWGPVVLVGLGGTLIEAIGDVRLLPADLSEADIAAEIEMLRAAKLLRGFRGSPAVDVAAVAHAAGQLGRLMRTVPEIVEIDVNPLVVHAKGDGVTALDALIVTEK